MKLPSSHEYFHAFKAIEDRVTPKQREMLCVHHDAPARVLTAVRLAELVGYETYSATNLQYGKLATAVADELGFNLEGRVKAGMLVEFVPPQTAGNEHWLWVMRFPVAQALEELGWVERTTHLLYPDTALPTDFDQPDDTRS